MIHGTVGTISSNHYFEVLLLLKATSYHDLELRLIGVDNETLDMTVSVCNDETKRNVTRKQPP